MLGKVVALVVTMSDDCISVLVDLLEKLSSNSGGEWLGELKHFLRKEPCWVVVNYLRKLSGTPIILTATDGTATIAESNDVFDGYIDPDFKNWKLDNSSEARPEAKVEVYELVKDGRFKQFFSSTINGSVAPDDLRKLCLTQHQIVDFCRNHRGELRTDGFATFFLFEGKKKGEFFVAGVRFVSDGRLDVDVRRFSDDGVWDAEDRLRVVLPQRSLES